MIITRKANNPSTCLTIIVTAIPMLQAAIKIAEISNWVFLPNIFINTVIPIIIPTNETNVAINDTYESI